MKSVLTPRKEGRIKVLCLDKPGSEIARMLHVSKSVVNRYIRRNCPEVTKEIKNQLRLSARIGKTTFSKREDNYIRENYLVMPLKRMAANMGRSDCGIRNRMKNMGLVVPAEVIEQRKQDSRIKKGNISFNKGKKQSEYMSQEAINRTKKTRFQKGGKPHNTKDSDGVITIRKDKRGIPYKHIRVSLGLWVPLHRHEWEAVHGSIPKGMKLIFKDRNTLNCDVSNLELVTAGELMKRNSFYNYPAAIIEIVRVQAKLTRAIRKQTKRLTNEKQDQ